MGGFNASRFQFRWIAILSLSILASICCFCLLECSLTIHRLTSSATDHSLRKENAHRPCRWDPMSVQYEIGCQWDLMRSLVDGSDGIVASISVQSPLLSAGRHAQPRGHHQSRLWVRMLCWGRDHPNGKYGHKCSLPVSKTPPTPTPPWSHWPSSLPIRHRISCVYRLYLRTSPTLSSVGHHPQKVSSFIDWSSEHQQRIKGVTCDSHHESLCARTSLEFVKLSRMGMKLQNYFFCIVCGQHHVCL